MVTIQFMFNKRDDAIRIHQNIYSCLTNKDNLVGLPRYVPRLKKYVVPLYCCPVFDESDSIDITNYTIQVPWSSISNSILQLPKRKKYKKKGLVHV